VLQAVMAERDDAIVKARGSDERYRAFVANSSEAIFRTELAEPMPSRCRSTSRCLGARNGYVAECNAAFMVALGVKDAGSPMVERVSRTIPPGRASTSSAFARQSATTTRSRNIEHVVHGPYGLDRVLLISMVGIVENGHVLRFWGTGRDVTAMREAENALAQHDAQLRALATRSRWPRNARAASSPANCTTARRRTHRHEPHARGDEAPSHGSRTGRTIVELEQVLADTTLQTRTLMLELAPPGLHETDWWKRCAGWPSACASSSACWSRSKRRRSQATRGLRQYPVVPDGA
jgi:PAS domain-containing protein